MAHTTGNAAVEDVFATWINRAFVSDLEFELQHHKFTTKGSIEKGTGANILRFVEFEPPGRTTGGPNNSYTGTGSAVIAEASTTANEITSITTSAVNITVAEYGEFLKIGKLYEYASVEGTREKLRKRLKDGAAASIDSAVRLAATSTTNLIYATAAQTGGVTSGPSTLTGLGAATLMLAHKVMKNNLAPAITGVPGHPNNHYAAILTPLQELDVVTEVTTLRFYWSGAVTPVGGTQGADKWINGYIGSVYGVAAYVTQNYSTVTYTSAAQTGWVYADGGVGAASFGDMEPQVIINDVNSPYKNVNSIAWHAMFGVSLLRAASVIRLYSTGA